MPGGCRSLRQGRPASLGAEGAEQAFLHHQCRGQGAVEETWEAGSRSEIGGPLALWCPDRATEHWRGPEGQGLRVSCTLQCQAAHSSQKATVLCLETSIN